MSTDLLTTIDGRLKELNKTLNQIRVVKEGDFVLPEDHNLQTTALLYTRDILQLMRDKLEELQKAPPGVGVTWSKYIIGETGNYADFDDAIDDINADIDAGKTNILILFQAHPNEYNWSKTIDCKNERITLHFVLPNVLLKINTETPVINVEGFPTLMFYHGTAQTYANAKFGASEIYLFHAQMIQDPNGIYYPIIAPSGMIYARYGFGVFEMSPEGAFVYGPYVVAYDSVVGIRVSADVMIPGALYVSELSIDLRTNVKYLVGALTSVMSVITFDGNNSYYVSDAIVHQADIILSSMFRARNVVDDPDYLIYEVKYPIGHNIFENISYKSAPLYSGRSFGDNYIVKTNEYF